jgi:hypothetical protein
MPSVAMVFLYTVLFPPKEKQTHDFFGVTANTKHCFTVFVILFIASYIPSYLAHSFKLF